MPVFLELRRMIYLPTIWGKGKNDGIMPHARINEHSLAANKQLKTIHYIKTMDGSQ